MKKILFIITVLFLFGCKKEPEVVFSDYPFLSMKEAEANSDGVLLQATILNYDDDSFDEFGFIWEQGGPIIENESYMVKLKQMDGTGFFQYKIVSDLIEDKEYFAKPFLKIGGLTVYGNEISFSGIQTEPQTIDGFSPNTGVTNDTITLVGRNFSRKKSRNRVFFGPYQAQVVKSTIDTLIVISPQPINQDGDLTISVRIGTTNVSTTDLYSLNSHVVFDFNPKEGFRGGGEIQINGRGFKGAGPISVFLNHSLSEITEVTNEQIKFRISLLAGIGKNSVNVRVRNFYEPSTDSILVKTRWHKIGDFPGVFRVFGTFLSDDSYGYLLGGLSHPSNVNFNEIWRFNPSLGDWMQLTPFPGTARYDAVGFIHGDDIFYGLGRSNADQNSFKDFWKYNIPSQTWQQLGNFPGQENLGKNVSMFLSDGEIFLTGGTLLEVWKYSPNQDNWTMIGYRQFIPSSFSGSMKFAFNYNGKAFFTFRNSNNRLEIFEFNKNYNGFIKSITDIFGYREACFLIDDKVYFPAAIITDVYNFTTDEWSSFEGFSGLTSSWTIYHNFSHEGKGYSLFIRRSNVFSNDVYVFDPTLF